MLGQVTASHAGTIDGTPLVVTVLMNLVCPLVLSSTGYVLADGFTRSAVPPDPYPDKSLRASRA